MTESNEIKIAVLQTQMDNIEEKVDNLDKKIDDGFSNLRKQIIEALSAKANRWVEDALRWAIYIIISAVIVGLLALLGLKTQL